MKKLLILSISVLLVAATAIITPSMAQGWVPRNGYWEVISTIARPSESTLRFYDLQGHMVAEERVTGKILDLQKRRICRWLNKKLQTALTAWASAK
jgi:hypothetical protein